MTLKMNGVWEATKRHIKVEFNGEIVAETTNGMLMIESPYEMHYYFPEADVRSDLLVDNGQTNDSKYKGTAKVFSLKVGDKVAEDAVWTFPEAKDKRPDMRGYYAFDWNKMDAWYEEDEEVIGHPRNPYHRVDTINSSRHVRIEVDGKTVAESNRPVLLFETSLPTRYYIPKDDVKVAITPTDTHTVCPYKGEADYWSFEVDGKTYQDLVWGYHETFNEVLKIKDRVAFYDEKVDVYIDGELQDKPRTVFG